MLDDEDYWRTGDTLVKEEQAWEPEPPSTTTQPEGAIIPYDISPSPSITPELEVDDEKELEKERAATKAAEEKAAQDGNFKQHKIDI